MICAFDTSCDTLSIALASDDGKILATKESCAKQISNQQLAPSLKEMIAQCGTNVKEISAILCGTGPGSYTGARIGIATAKGLSFALGCKVFGFQTIDSYAWGMFACGYRGSLLVANDALRKQLYVGEFLLSNEAPFVKRILPTKIVDTSDFFEQFACDVKSTANDEINLDGRIFCGNACIKYSEFVDDAGMNFCKDFVNPSSQYFVDAYVNNFENCKKRVASSKSLLPFYARLSDAQEDESARAIDDAAKAQRSKIDQRHIQDLYFHPVSLDDIDECVELMRAEMGCDAWDAFLLKSHVKDKNNIWFCARIDSKIVACGGGAVLGDAFELYKICVNGAYRGKKVATKLLSRLCQDARVFGVDKLCLEVRKSNEGARAFYENFGMQDCG
ncbi:MAG: tRNA (adenosine(37)-N6)-threonylcarbamoyltransferase complex dimerization subunit type 1 TsaB, partial [Coriobacteriales bacterium]|nr:tRNA (adenosine(37)-N6)-threonylcarbamoyltransferase complex dimerization subunit type 1 TsaB [Coriobacteriales bacterium]